MIDEVKKQIKLLGYKGCKNCQHQISPLRMCKWAEQGGNGYISFICPRWDKAESENMQIAESENMQIIINVPKKEFSIEIEDKFQDFFKRLEVETKEHLITNTSLLCGAYELETIKMFLDAFKNMEIIPNNETNGEEREV